MGRPSLGNARQPDTELPTLACASIGARPPPLFTQDSELALHPAYPPGRFDDFEKQLVGDTRGDVARRALQNTAQILRADEHVGSLPAADRLDVYMCRHRMTSS